MTMPSGQVLVRSSRPHAAYSLLLTTDSGQVRAAQRLRHRVFAEEFDAVLHGREAGLDIDRFDVFCDHLVIREDSSDEIVGTYRLLPPGAAQAAGGLYADGEFDLGAIDGLRSTMVEAGRSCVDPRHRNGTVIALVWAGIGHYLTLTGNRWLVGCASVSLRDGGSTAAGVWQHVRDRHLAPPRYRAVPRTPWETTAAPAANAVPPLLRGYLRLGAWILGPPAHDPAFACADFPVLLGIDHIDPRYARHFLGSPE